MEIESNAGGWPGLSVLSTNVNRRSFLEFGAGALALGASATLLAGCSTGPSSGSGGAKELSFWNFRGPTPAKGDTQSKWFVKMVDDWNAGHDVKVKLRFIPPPDYLAGTVLQTAFASGSGPDIFLLSPGDFLRYYNGGVLKDLTPAIKPNVISDFLPGTLDTRMVDGKIFALPMESDPVAIYYSKAAFKDAGLGDSDIPKTWDDLLGVAKELTTEKRFGLLFETIPGYYQNFTWYPFMWQGNGSPVGQGKKGTFNSDPVKAALKMWGDSISTRVAPRKPLGTGANDGPSNLGSGYVAMQQMNPTSVSLLRNKVPDFEYGVFPLPTPPGGKPATVLGGWAFTANAKGANPDAAAEFIAWAIGSSSADSIERGRSWVAEAKPTMPVRKSVHEVANAMGAFDDPHMKIFAEIAPTGRGEPRYPPEIIKAISDAIQGVQLGGQNPASAASTANSTIDSFLASYKGASVV